jgi:hypothetical protein
MAAPNSSLGKPALRDRAQKLTICAAPQAK